MTLQIRTANNEDLLKLKSFLADAGVSVEGLHDSIENFSFLENEEGDLRACLGIESVEKSGLLRSFVVSPQIDQTELMIFFRSAFQKGKEKGLEALYLVTNKRNAISLFESIGFEMVDESEMPASVWEKKYFRKVLTVDNSKIMKIIL